MAAALMAMLAVLVIGIGLPIYFWMAGTVLRSRLLVAVAACATFVPLAPIGDALLPNPTPWLTLATAACWPISILLALVVARRHRPDPQRFAKAVRRRFWRARG